MPASSVLRLRIGFSTAFGFEAGTFFAGALAVRLAGLAVLFEGGCSGVGLTTRGERLLAGGLASAGLLVSSLAVNGSSESDGT